MWSRSLQVCLTSVGTGQFVCRALSSRACLTSVGTGQFGLYGFLGPNLKVMAFLGQNWFILSYFSSERGLSSGTGSSELASGTSTSELVCPRACLLLR